MALASALRVSTHALKSDGFSPTLDDILFVLFLIHVSPLPCFILLLLVLERNIKVSEQLELGGQDRVDIMWQVSLFAF